VLKWVMDPYKSGLHRDLFGNTLLGICFINIVEAGFIFSGNVGTGIILARDENDGSWSPPCAIGLTGVGWGFILGASVKDIVYLIYDRETMKAMRGDIGFKLGTQAEASLFNWGRTAEATFNITNKGVGTNIALSYSKGIFGGISIEGALCNPRTRVNEKFYAKKEVSPKDILLDRSVEIPDGTLLPEVYDKLNKLCSGELTYEVTDAEKKKAEEIRAKAEKEGEEHLKEESVEFVDVTKELEKKD
jgi:lipid-binding SYLF domain-containing protein